MVKCKTITISRQSVNLYLKMDLLTPAHDQHKPYELATMPVTGMRADYANGWLIPPHSHCRAQLLYAIRGVMAIDADHGRWIVPPTRGVWIKQGELHSVKMHGDVSMHTLFIDADAAAGLPTSTCVLDIQPLMKALIVEIAQAGLSYAQDSREARIAQLILDEIQLYPALPFHLPWPSSPRLKQVCEQMTQQLDDARPSQAWALQLGISDKSLHRHFKQETGITFGQWREQARMLKAVEAIAQGHKLLHVALSVGYQSQSAFSAVFKKHFGLSPSAYYQNLPAK
ncbi:helix-turn-helix transcriptional regulator [Methylophilus sp. QUAN]|uniref:AraC family transcriptional regulator n=1 Tax=Methylophilus sp. QUAN TaxID=2781020 RepID=UPI001E60B6DD|nr:helix-turn-helix transcriptional regulator [Methylophilus sp. QUAN]